jgi:uncharacterized membrane protein YbhN (UPF0104 family)
VTGRRDDAVEDGGHGRATLPWFRILLGIGGLVVLGALVHHVGPSVVLATLRGAVAWLPALCALELLRIASETAGTYWAFGRLARRIPRRTLFRAHVLGHSMANIAPAPSVVSESIKATLVTPHVGVGAAASVAFINQAATLIAVGLFSIPCGIAILVLREGIVWFWACSIHAIVLVGSGLLLQAATRAAGPGRWLVKRFPRMAARAEAFRAHAVGGGWLAGRTTAALLVGRALQTLQLGLAARAVGIDAGLLRALAAEGVNLVAAAVFVMVPGGLGTTDGAFALAADVMGTSAAKATALALLIRCMQLVWVMIASLLALGGKRTRARVTRA